MRPDAFPFFKRLLKRRPDEGWLNAPFLKRPIEGGSEKYVLKTLNFLLKKAVDKCLPRWDLLDINMKIIRHTSFNLMLIHIKIHNKKNITGVSFVINYIFSTNRARSIDFYPLVYTFLMEYMITIF